MPAIPTPMDADGCVAEEALRKVVEFNIEAGVHGFWVSGGTGESVLLDDTENMRVVEIVVDQGKGRVKNIIHVGAATTSRAAQLAEHAAAAGAEAVCEGAGEPVVSPSRGEVAPSRDGRCSRLYQATVQRHDRIAP